MIASRLLQISFHNNKDRAVGGQKADIIKDHDYFSGFKAMLLQQYVTLSGSFKDQGVAEKTLNEMKVSVKLV